jgi:hypothetical protein
MLPIRHYVLAAAIALAGSCGGQATSKPKAPEQLSARDIVEKYKSAIVRIENNMGAQVGVGTGFFVTEQGRVATNLHVISGGGALTVRLSDGTVFDVQRVVAVDADKDLAVIEIDAPTKMPTVPLGDSDGVVPGDAVVAIGNPMRLDFTVSDGLISSVRAIEDGVILQISAPISQGSSGGPLFNQYGQVIGVATMVYNGGQNLNFGVPINDLRPLVEHKGSEPVAEFAKRFTKPPPNRLIKTGKGTIKREIPSHETKMLKPCSREQLLKVFNGINRAVELGAPLYNDGDHEACFGIYRQTAAHFEKDKDMCKSVRDAFGAGMLKAETKADFTAKAWTMRDTFDGLLAVIMRLAQEVGAPR